MNPLRCGCSTEGKAWGEWPKTGKRMLGDLDARGNLVLKDGFWIHAQPDNPEFDDLPKYTSHHAACPKAKAFARLARRKVRS